MLWAKCNYQRTANIFCLKLELLFIILLSLEYISPFLGPLVSFEFSLKCFHWIPRIQCDHSDSKTRVRDKILKLIPIHAVILQILRIRWFSFPFSKTPLFQTSIDIFPGFQSEGLSPCLYGSRPANNEFYRFPLVRRLPISWQSHVPNPFHPVTFSSNFGSQTRVTLYMDRRSNDARLQLDLLRRYDFIECLKYPVTFAATNNVN